MTMDESHIDKSHVEAIEASRPGSSDLADHFPETASAIRDDERLRRFANRVEAVDQRIARIMESVEIPEGLSDRLKVALSAGEVGSSPVEVVNREERLPPSRFSRVSSRRWAAWSVGLASSAACLVVAAIFALGGSSQSEMNAVIASFESTEKARSSGRWKTAPADFQLPPQIRRATVVPQVLQVRTAEHGNATLVKLGQSATLLIAKGSRRALPGEPLVQQGPQTGRYRYTAWSAGGFTYLLAVKGGKLEDFLVGTDGLISLSMPARGGKFSSIGTTVTGIDWLILV